MAENNKSMNDLGARIREALWRIRNLAQEIVETAADPSRRLSDLFSEGAIQEKINACIELALAVADCNRTKWLREVRTEIEETQNVVIAADNALSPCMTLNPEMMNHFLGAEQKVFDMMLSPSPKLLALAKFARMMRSQLATYLHKECVSIRIELLHWESGRGGLGSGDSGLGVDAQTAQARELVKYGGMRTLSSVELKILLDFFQESPGYVLDFTDASFNEFTEREIGVRVKDLYRNEGLSKHKALCKFCNSRGNEEKAYKLLSSLMNYYDLTQRDNITFNERGEREYSKCKEILRSFRPIDSGSAQLSLDEMDGKLRALYKDGALFLVASSEDKITIGLKHLSAFIEAAILKCEWRVFAHPLVVRVLTDIAKLGGETIRPTETKLAEAAWREFGNKVNALLLLVSKLPNYAQAATTARQKLGLCFQRGIVDNDGGDHFYRIISSSVLAELLDHFKWIAIQCHPRYKDTIELMYCGIFNNEWESFDFLPLGKNDSGGEPIPDDFLANAIPVRPRTRIEEVRLAKSKWLKDHADIARRYNLAQIEMDLLAAMPEASEWRFFKACTLLEKTIRGAVERFDPLLGYWPWFKWGLSILSKSPYANRNRSKQDVQYIVGDISQAIADVIVELLNWQKTCYKTYFFEVDGGSPLAKAIFDNLGEHETAKGSTEKIVEQIQKRVFMPDGDMIRYDGAVFDAILAACPYNLLEPTDFPEDIVSEVVAHDIFFIEENDMGWYDGDFDKWHNDAVVKIDLARQAKKREEAQKPAGKTEEEPVKTEEKKEVFSTVDEVIRHLCKKDAESEVAHLMRIETLFKENWFYIVTEDGKADEKPDGFHLFETLAHTLERGIEEITKKQITVPLSCCTWQNILPEALAFPYDEALYHEATEDDAPGTVEYTLADTRKVRISWTLRPHPLSSYIDTVKDLLLKYLTEAFKLARHVKSQSAEKWATALGCYKRVNLAMRMPQSRPLLDQMARAMIDAATLLSVDLELAENENPVENEDKVAKAVRKELAPEFQKISEDHKRQEGLLGDLKDKVGALGRKVAAGFTSVRDFNARWLGIFGKLFKYKKTPTEDVNNAMEDRYAVVNWERIKGEGCRQQIKDVIDYTYDEKPIIRKVSKKHLKEGTRIEGVNLKQACREAGIKHKEEWAKLKDKYADVDKLYDTCHSLFNSRRGKNPFKTI